MKKQIFILAFLMLATFASITKSYGQAVPGSAPRPLLCTGDAMNPIAGRSYDYTATFNPDGGTAFWYATRSTALTAVGARVATVEASGGSVLSSASANYATNITPTAGATTSSINWNSAVIASVAPATPLLVVVEYDAPAANCANNLKVFNIVPKNAFTIDILSMLSTGASSAAYDAKTTQCAADILSAAYNTTNFKMDMNYGVQTLYFEIIAANFNASFVPSYQISGLATGQTAEIFWGATVATATTSLGAAANGATVAGTSVTTATLDTRNGVSIIVKVVVNNNNVENLAGETIRLAVDAVNAAGLADVKEADCTPNTAFADYAEQDITLRPTITPTAPLTAIVAN